MSRFSSNESREAVACRASILCKCRQLRYSLPRVAHMTIHYRITRPHVQDTRGRPLVVHARSDISSGKYPGRRLGDKEWVNRVDRTRWSVAITRCPSPGTLQSAVSYNRRSMKPPRVGNQFGRCKRFPILPRARPGEIIGQRKANTPTAESLHRAFRIQLEGPFSSRFLIIKVLRHAHIGLP
jgi:hypothetical protein